MRQITQDGCKLDTQDLQRLAHVPEHLRDGLQRYVERRIPPGSFLVAVLSNDLREAFARADDESREGMHSVLIWLYNYAPGPCHGSADKVREWLDGSRWAAIKADVEQIGEVA